MNKEGLILLLIAVAFVELSKSQNLCDLRCPNLRLQPVYKPSTCLYDNRIKCDVVRRELTPAEKKYIVDAHNALRSRVASGQESRGSPGPQPRAKGGYLKPLTWSDEIAYVAQHWANQCKGKVHNDCPRLVDYQLGENLYYGTDNGDAVKRAIKLWSDEVAFYDSRRISRLQYSDKTGHYTQMVWGETDKIGCGAVTYASNNKMLLICNYGPTGNYQNEPVYEVENYYG